jgi:ABC-type transport system involved in cytochrome c biogenesis permease component
MKGLVQAFVVSLRLHFRNRMALIYSYIFPTIFLVAFWVLYRYDRVPLVRHMGELLTVTALGGACFGLPTTMVSERERGVWRRFRLAPVSTGSLVASTVMARYVLLLLAGLLQVVLAMVVGMPRPPHPVDLWLAFTCVAFAFMGLGLVIAMLADNVPAVQALGQCIFLPMLIIGGVAVPLASLPAWAQHLSAFFPGRYAVDAIQQTVTGPGLTAGTFSLLALVVIGLAGCVAGAGLFRWDAAERFSARGGTRWVVLALLAWVAVGAAAEWQGRIASQEPATATRAAVPPPAPVAPPPAGEAPATSEAGAGNAATPTPPAAPSTSNAQPATNATPAMAPASSGSAPTAPSTTHARGTGRGAAAASGDEASPPTERARGAAVETAPTPPMTRGADESKAAAAGTEQPASTAPARWQDVTLADIDQTLVFDRLPPDSGVVTPIAKLDEIADPDDNYQLEAMTAALATWAPGRVEDPVQRVRNYLFVPAVIDVFQMPIERFVPLIIFNQLKTTVPKDQLVKILFWIAVHPDQGDDSAINDLRSLGIDRAPNDVLEVRNRTGVYAVKFLGRLLGKIVQQ